MHPFNFYGFPACLCIPPIIFVPFAFFRFFSFLLSYFVFFFFFYALVGALRMFICTYLVQQTTRYRLRNHSVHYWVWSRPDRLMRRTHRRARTHTGVLSRSPHSFQNLQQYSNALLRSCRKTGQAKHEGRGRTSAWCVLNGRTDEGWLL